MEKIIPVLDAVPRKDGHGLRVYCTYCQKSHFHGYSDGHRVAHCDNPTSPYLKTGYVIKSKADDLIAEMNQSLKPVQEFSKYVKHHGISFFSPDTLKIAERARRGPKFRDKDIPRYVDPQHQQNIANLLNNMIEHYKKRGV